MMLEIRLARADEAVALTELALRSKKSNGYDAAFMEACREELTITAASMAAGEYWVAYQGDYLCGFAGLIVDRKAAIGKIVDFFIDPTWKRQGVGRLLWNKILMRAKDNQLVKLHLDADPFAVPFYEAMGFKVVGKIPSGSIEGRMLPRMEMRIAKGRY